jgi:hypothetical protein
LCLVLESPRLPLAAFLAGSSANPAHVAGVRLASEALAGPKIGITHALPLTALLTQDLLAVRRRTAGSL